MAKCLSKCLPACFASAAEGERRRETKNDGPRLPADRITWLLARNRKSAYIRDGVGRIEASVVQCAPTGSSVQTVNQTRTTCCLRSALFSSGGAPVRRLLFGFAIGRSSGPVHCQADCRSCRSVTIV
ncbi:hypothetical protein HPP92_017848 [Vanilla planifolia]|uniref:Uncharacterized protein n=1 Tax=Vanilla planifolia TaxID=51239 RepID=A0A835UQ12_VANPL|nr:hypothetical protein HPP92_018430 [Vanilla planifolia]KAG0468520.1 hypothetical protein HPP92_017848 [Vanilla planifolia]